MRLARATLAAAACVLSPAALSQSPPPPSASEGAGQIRLNRPGGGGAAQPSSPTESGPTVIGDISAEEAVTLFQSAGFDSVRLVEDKGGDFVRIRFDQSDSFIFLLNCASGRCRSLMFTAFLRQRRGASLNVVNGYNLRTVHSRLARNDAGEIVLTMAANLNKGVTAEHLRSFGPFWMQVHRDALAAR